MAPRSSLTPSFSTTAISAGVGAMTNAFEACFDNWKLPWSGNNAIAIGGGRWNEEGGAQNINMGDLDHMNIDGMLKLIRPNTKRRES